MISAFNDARKEAYIYLEIQKIKQTVLTACMGIAGATEISVDSFSRTEQGKKPAFDEESAYALFSVHSRSKMDGFELIERGSASVRPMERDSASGGRQVQDIQEEEDLREQERFQEENPGDFNQELFVEDDESGDDANMMLGEQVLSNGTSGGTAPKRPASTPSAGADAKKLCSSGMFGIIERQIKDKKEATEYERALHDKLAAAAVEVIKLKDQNQLKDMDRELQSEKEKTRKLEKKLTKLSLKLEQSTSSAAVNADVQARLDDMAAVHSGELAAKEAALEAKDVEHKAALEAKDAATKRMESDLARSADQLRWALGAREEMEAALGARDVEITGMLKAKDVKMDAALEEKDMVIKKTRDDMSVLMKARTQEINTVRSVLEDQIADREDVIERMLGRGFDDPDVLKREKADLLAKYEAEQAGRAAEKAEWGVERTAFAAELEAKGAEMKAALEARDELQAALEAKEAALTRNANFTAHALAFREEEMHRYLYNRKHEIKEKRLEACEREKAELLAKNQTLQAENDKWEQEKTKLEQAKTALMERLGGAAGALSGSMQTNVQYLQEVRVSYCNGMVWSCLLTFEKQGAQLRVGVLAMIPECWERNWVIGFKASDGDQDGTGIFTALMNMVGKRFFPLGHPNNARVKYQQCGCIKRLVGGMVHVFVPFYNAAPLSALRELVKACMTGTFTVLTLRDGAHWTVSSFASTFEQAAAYGMVPNYEVGMGDLALAAGGGDMEED